VKASAFPGTPDTPWPENLPAHALGRFLDLTTHRVQEIAKHNPGVKTERGQYDFAAFVQAHIASLKGRSKGNAAADERLKLARAEREEIRVAKDRGELLPAADVAREWASILADIRAALLAVPQRVAGRTGLNREAVAALDAEIRETLEALADGKG